MTALRPKEDARTFERAIRFLIVGMVNTAFGYSIYAILYLAGLSPQTALAIAFVAGVLWNFRTHSSFVFGAKGFRRLPLYAAVYVALYLTNRFLLGFALNLGVHPLAAQAVLSVVMAGISFVSISLVLRSKV